MSIDSFFGLDDADGQMSPDKVREYKARQARNQKMMAAAHKQEQKQKKKEENLVQILLKFIQTNKKPELTLLISRCLEQNMPAVVILAIVMLGNEEIQQEMGIRLELGGGSIGESQDEPVQEGTPDDRTLEEMVEPETTGALVIFGGANHAFPLKMRIAVDLWTKNVWEAMSPIPDRIFKTVAEWNEDESAVPEPKSVVVQLTAFVVREYFQQNAAEKPLEMFQSFGQFFMKGLLNRLKEQVKSQVQLGGEAY